MRNIFILLALLYTAIYAQSYKVATKSCQLYNDLKHKKNSFNKRLKVGESYRVTREQSDHYYIYVPNITISNRWVEKSCFEDDNKKEIIESKKPIDDSVVIKLDQSSATITKSIDHSSTELSPKPHSLLLALSWQNAFCEQHRRRRECYRNSYNIKYDNKFVLHGLWPQPRDNIYCNVPREQKIYDKNHQWNRIKDIGISDRVIQELKKVMPGVSSNLHRHEWIKHGTCYGMTADKYYTDAISLTKQVNRSKLAHFFSQKQGNIVTLQQIRFKVDESFGKGSGKRVEMRCKSGLITELWFHIGYGDANLTTLLKSGKSVRSRCSRGKIDRAGY